MAECPPLDWTSEDVCGNGDGDQDPTAAGDVPLTKPSRVGETACGGDDVEKARLWRRRQNVARRARLKAQIEAILRELRTPLRDIVREHVLPRLPVQSLLRFASVSASWRRLVSAPIFRHTQSHSHQSASGVFAHMLPDVPAYYPFDPFAGSVPDPSLAFLPGSPFIAALASSNGLLCCAGILHSYYVCNPSTAEWTPLPEPPPPKLAYHLADDGRTAMALVFEPSATKLEADYHLVRAYELSDDVQGVYGFQVFSSSAGGWRVSSDVCDAERLIHDSGVSAGGLAYWRTTMQTVVAYDPAADTCRSVPWPMRYDPTASWQLGEMHGRLCCTCVTDLSVEVYALGGGDRWSAVASFRIVEGQGEDDVEVIGGSPVFRFRPWPLRFQSGESEVLLWVSGRIVGLDVAARRVRELCVAPGTPGMTPDAVYLPHISTFARVFPMMGRILCTP